MPKWQKVTITRENLADLKGKWSGQRWAGGTMSAANTEMEIFNDTLPIQAKFIFHEVLRAGGEQARTETWDFKAKINEKGNFYSKGTNFEVELSLYKDDGKMKLEGDFLGAGVSRKVTIEMKKK